MARRTRTRPPKDDIPKIKFKRPRSPRAMSPISTGTRLHPSGTDGRSERGRRWGDLYRELIAQFEGGPSLLDTIACRNCATLLIAAEALQSEVARGANVNPEVLARSITRADRALKQVLDRAKATALAESIDPLTAALARADDGER